MVAPSGAKWSDEARDVAPMFLGEFQHTLDAKGRVILPARYREALEEGAVMTKVDGALAVYPRNDWEEVARRIQERAREGGTQRQAARAYFAGAAEVTPDRQGRIAVPQQLRTYAGLERDVVVVGVFDRLEVWDAQRWRERLEEGDRSLSTGAEELSDFIS